MKNKHILTGIFVFLFSAIVLYLALDTGKETYSVSPGFTLNFQETNNDDGRYGVVTISWEPATNQQAACSIIHNGMIHASSFTFNWNNSTSTCQTDVYYGGNGIEPENPYCESNDYQFVLTVDYYYYAPGSNYCYDGYSYNGEYEMCYLSGNEPSDPSDPDDPVDPSDPDEPSLTIERTIEYKCSTDGDFECNMFTPSTDTTTDKLMFPVTSEEPSKKDYTFLYWVTSVGKNHYYHSCSGVNDDACHDTINLKSTTKKVTLYAVWKEEESSGGNTNNNPKITYYCGSADGKDISCDDLPKVQYSSSSSGGTLSISKTIPKDKSGKYVFSHWVHNPPKSYIYSSDCSGLSNNCKTKITITRNNRLYAVWQVESGSTTPSDVYIKYKCGSYEDDDVVYDVECNNLPGDTKAINGTGIISETVPVDKADELEFKYWKSNYFGDNVSFCHNGCDRDRIKNMSHNNILYAVWQPKNAEATGNYAIEYICDEGDCTGISKTTGTKSTLTITDKIPTRKGYAFVYWKLDDDNLYCNPANEELDCYKLVKFNESGTIKVKAVWLKDDDVSSPSVSGYSKTSNDSNNGTGPPTGLSSLYVAIILCLAMFGYSYYYFRKTKNN